MAQVDEGAARPPAFASASPVGFGPGPSPSAPGELAPGVRLNDIFEITRFIARGGMGAVYEGVNISSGERVAVKVLLPGLLHDQRSWELFRREANLLTRISHPAIVGYRVLAQDAGLGAPYLVTEFIDGAPLSDRLVGRPTPPHDVLALVKRLAEGLGRAHELGAVHRDLSPDNILLPGGDLAEAKVIDFGIAKDLDPHASTIIGGGFAGKLGYCAPEQLGDYGGEIGPWTDIYSLGLVAYTVAVGRPIDMGVTLSQAVDRRRRGVDIAELSDRLRPLVLSMLRPDPARRLRAMDEVRDAADGLQRALDRRDRRRRTDRRAVEAATRTELLLPPRREPTVFAPSPDAAASLEGEPPASAPSFPPPAFPPPAILAPPVSAPTFVELAAGPAPARRPTLLVAGVAGGALAAVVAAGIVVAPRPAPARRAPPLSEPYPAVAPVAGPIAAAVPVAPAAEAPAVVSQVLSPTTVGPRPAATGSASAPEATPPAPAAVRARSRPPHALSSAPTPAAEPARAAADPRKPPSRADDLKGLY